MSRAITLIMSSDEEDWEPEGEDDYESDDSEAASVNVCPVCRVEIITAPKILFLNSTGDRLSCPICLESNESEAMRFYSLRCGHILCCHCCASCGLIASVPSPSPPRRNISEIQEAMSGLNIQEDDFRQADGDITSTPQATSTPRARRSGTLQETSLTPIQRERLDEGYGKRGKGREIPPHLKTRKRTMEKKTEILSRVRTGKNITANQLKHITIYCDPEETFESPDGKSHHEFRIRFLNAMIERNELLGLPIHVDWDVALLSLFPKDSLDDDNDNMAGMPDSETNMPDNEAGSGVQASLDPSGESSEAGMPFPDEPVEDAATRNRELMRIAAEARLNAATIDAAANGAKTDET